MSIFQRSDQLKIIVLWDAKTTFYDRAQYNSRGQEVRVEALFRGIKPIEKRTLCGSSKSSWVKRSTCQALRMPDGELLIVATDKLSCFAIKRYGLRWEIKNHGRKAVSYFRYGLDVIRDIVLNGVRWADNFYIK